jgi:chromosome segregation ATPase
LRKVATLKKSYEARGEKKCAELQARLHELEKQNDDLIAAKDATFSGPVASDVTFSGEAEAELKYQIEEQRAQFARLEAEMFTSRQHQQQLERELAQERIEKGDLVAAVDEMLLLQSEQGASAQGAMSVVEDYRKSISRPASALSSTSGLRAPGGGGGGVGGVGGSRIGGVGRPSSGIAKGGMMSRIEKMGASGRTGSGGHE